jgi:hypothetical protein|tara:strand:- start:1343 stop:1606 length:264 start_codon:yes stop_codon:yes gene_type:complete
MTTLEVKDIPRHEEDNPYGYTDQQKDEKRLALKNMKELYPDVNEYYAELVYDMVMNKTQEEIDVIKEKVETVPFKYAEKVLEIENKN